MSNGIGNHGDSAGDGRFGEQFVEFSGNDNKGGWLVTYADMMTIILTFMIMLLSVSTIAQTKFDMLVEAITGRKVGNLHKVKEKVDQVVERASLGGQVQTSIDEDGLKVQFSNALLFPSGEAELTDEAVEVFRPIADHLVGELEPAYGVTIEGYTDDVPIENGKFESNWDLSTSRAIHVMERLAREGFDRRRMSVQGFADTRAATDVPLYDEKAIEDMSDQKLEKLRGKNRRVVLRIDRLDPDVVEDLVDGRAKPSGEGAGLPPEESPGRPNESATGGGEASGSPMIDDLRGDGNEAEEAQ
jgi:chemotaxis protein MotB